MTRKNTGKQKQAYQLRKLINQNTFALVETYNLRGNSQLDQLTYWTNDCYNELMYLLRQQYFANSKKFKKQLRDYKRKRSKAKTKPKWNKVYSNQDLFDILVRQDQNGQNTLLRDCPNRHILQDLIKTVKQAWINYYKAKADYNKHPYKYLTKPKIPHYLKKNKRHSVNINNQTIQYKDGYFTNRKLGLKIKASDNLKQALTNPTNDPYLAKIKPKSIIRTYWLKPIANHDYKLCVTYLVSKKPKQTYKGRPVPARQSNIYVAGDPGVDNLMTLITNNIDYHPLIINGKGLKSVNHYYNKRLHELKHLATQYKQKPITVHKKDSTTQTIYRTGKRAEKLTAWRNNKLHEAIHKATDKILEYAINCGASKIIIGRNKYWKQKSKLGKSNNQNFVGLPHWKVIQMLSYKAKLYGIQVISQPEAYTSQTSFLDNELPIWRNGDKARKQLGKSPIKRRIKRGLYKTNIGYLINADVNGALQIGRKYNHNYNLQVFCNSSNQLVTTKQIIRCVLHPVKWSPSF